MSDAYDAEEADMEAAERLRVAEWAAEHQNPLTAALQRAERAEEVAADLGRLLYEHERLTVDIDEALGRHSTCIVKRDGRVIFDGVSRDALLRSGLGPRDTTGGGRS